MFKTPLPFCLYLQLVYQPPDVTLLGGAIKCFQRRLSHIGLVGGAMDGHTGDLLPGRWDEDLLGAGGPGLLRKQKSHISEHDRKLALILLNQHRQSAGMGQTNGVVLRKQGGRKTNWIQFLLQAKAQSQISEQPFPSHSLIIALPCNKCTGWCHAKHKLVKRCQQSHQIRY